MNVTVRDIKPNETLAEYAKSLSTTGEKGAGGISKKEFAKFKAAFDAYKSKSGEGPQVKELERKYPRLAQELESKNPDYTAYVGRVLQNKEILMQGASSRINLNLPLGEISQLLGPDNRTVEQAWAQLSTHLVKIKPGDAYEKRCDPLLAKEWMKGPSGLLPIEKKLAAWIVKLCTDVPVTQLKFGPPPTLSGKRQKPAKVSIDTIGTPGSDERMLAERLYYANPNRSPDRTLREADFDITIPCANDHDKILQQSLKLTLFMARESLDQNFQYLSKNICHQSDVKIDMTSTALFSYKKTVDGSKRWNIERQYCDSELVVQAPPGSRIIIQGAGVSNVTVEGEQPPVLWPVIPYEWSSTEDIGSFRMKEGKTKLTFAMGQNTGDFTILILGPEAAPGELPKVLAKRAIRLPDRVEEMGSIPEPGLHEV